MITKKTELARVFAEYAHSCLTPDGEPQLRKYTGVPYSNHCNKVAMLLDIYLDESKLTEDMVCAAYLHDVQEMTSVNYETIRLVFGTNVADMVWALTDYSVRTNSVENRKKRKQMDCISLAAATREVQTIKCCDLIDNTISIVQHDKKFAAVYLKEKRALLDVMDKADKEVREVAYRVLEESEKQLENLE